jgi:hypothetical protein
MRIEVVLVIVACGHPSAGDPACTDTFYADADGDGHGNARMPLTDCAAPSGYTTTSDDCDDERAAVHPGADEIFNALDDDCDVDVDEDAIDALVWYTDADGDGFGDDGAVTTACTAAADQVAVAGDCADDDAAVNPDEDELCNDVDDDCDGFVDSADPSLVQGTIWYADADVDGYGDPATGAHFCEKPAGRTTDSSDCDDTDGTVHPNVDEICDGIDDDCDGLVDIDDDSLLDAATFYADVDGDGVGSTSEALEECAAPAGYVATSGDCDDADPAVGLPLDYYPDSDGDGYGFGGATAACEPSGNRVLVHGDCEPMDPSIHPGASELCDSVDNNCDGLVDADDPLAVPTTYYADDDGDGFGDATDTVDSCGAVTGYVEDASDCADGDAAIHPGAPEYCDAIDNDCDGTTDGSVVYVDWYADDDGDGYGDDGDVQNDCLPPSGYVLAPGDCDDAEATTFPGAREVCSNDADDDCDGTEDNCTFGDADVTIDGAYYAWPYGVGQNIAVGDLDDDGTADLLFGCPTCPDILNPVGHVSIVYGPVTGAMTVEDAVTISGTVPWSPEDLGLDVTTGDANGDGGDDVLVAARTGFYLFFGPVTASALSSAADATFTTRFYWTGNRDIAVASDVDGDGESDVVVAIPDADCRSPSGGPLVSECGNVFVASANATGEVALSDATYTFYGAEDDNLGEGVSAGDANGDGVSDLTMVGGGTIFLIDGGGLTAGGYAPASVASGTIVTDSSAGTLGRAKQRSVDYDGDGYADLLVGSESDYAYLFNSPIVGDITSSDAEVRWEIDAYGMDLGTDLTAGDVDGDGQIDVLLGAPSFASGDDPDGAAYLQIGKASGVVDVSTLAYFPGPEGRGAGLGRAVAFVPDWDGDGLPEMAIGAASWEDAVGRTYLWWSGNVF